MQALEDGGMQGQDLGDAAIAGTETFGKVAEWFKKMQKKMQSGSE